jgi:hypothetical protein
MVAPKQPGFLEYFCTASDRRSLREVNSREQAQANKVGLNRQFVLHKWRFSLPFTEAMLCRLNDLPD